MEIKPVTKERGPMQDFLDAVKEAKKKGDVKGIVHEIHFPTLFEGTPMQVNNLRSLDVLDKATEDLIKLLDK